MDILKFAIGLLVPSIGAAFVWLLNIARKDPPLFREIDRVLTKWLGNVAFATASMAAFSFFMYPDEDSRAALGILVGLVIYALLSLHNALPFFRRVSEIGDRNSRSGPADKAT